jgi:hypothetical protein
VWWISYRGEGKTGVENISVFEDDGTPRKKHPLLLDPAPDAQPLKPWWPFCRRRASRYP